MTTGLVKKVKQDNVAETTPRSSGVTGHGSRGATPRAVGGNHSILRKIESGQIKVSQPGDRYEREADRMADKVMRMTKVPKGTESLPAKDALASLRKTPTSSELAPSGGEALSIRTREFFEPRFGKDLSHVRVHYNSRAADAADAVNAHAYTTGQDIVFGAGQYVPHVNAGNELLAHELAHVVQQSLVSRPLLHRRGLLNANAEREAVMFTRSRYYSRRQIEIIQQVVGAPRTGRYTGLTAEYVASWQRTRRSQVGLADGKVGSRTLTTMVSYLEAQGQAVEAAQLHGSGAVIEMPEISIIGQSPGPEEGPGEAIRVTVTAGEPCLFELPDLLLNLIRWQTNQLNLILSLFDMKIGHVAIGVRITGSLEAEVGGGLTGDFVGSINLGSGEVDLTAAVSGELILGAGGGANAGIITGFKAIPIQESPSEANYGEGVSIAIAGGYLGELGVSVSAELLTALLLGQTTKGWIGFSVTGGPVAEFQISGSLGKGVSACEVVEFILKEGF